MSWCFLTRWAGLRGLTLDLSTLPILTLQDTRRHADPILGDRGCPTTCITSNFRFACGTNRSYHSNSIGPATLTQPLDLSHRPALFTGAPRVGGAPAAGSSRRSATGRGPRQAAAGQVSRRRGRPGPRRGRQRHWCHHRHRNSRSSSTVTRASVPGSPPMRCHSPTGR